MEGLKVGFIEDQEVKLQLGHYLQKTIFKKVLFWVKRLWPNCISPMGKPLKLVL